MWRQKREHEGENERNRSGILCPRGLALLIKGRPVTRRSKPRYMIFPGNRETLAEEPRRSAVTSRVALPPPAPKRSALLRLQSARNRDSRADKRDEVACCAVRGHEEDQSLPTLIPHVAPPSARLTLGLIFLQLAEGSASPPARFFCLRSYLHNIRERTGRSAAQLVIRAY